MFGNRTLISTFAVFVTFSVYGYLVWGVLLGEAMYAEMGGIWRPEGEELMLWIFVAYAIMAYLTTLIWRYGQEGKGIAEGFRYGLMAGGIFASAELIAFAVQPITLKGALMAFGIDLLMFVIAGMVLQVVYKKFGA